MIVLSRSRTHACFTRIETARILSNDKRNVIITAGVVKQSSCRVRSKVRLKNHDLLTYTIFLKFKAANDCCCCFLQIGKSSTKIFKPKLISCSWIQVNGTWRYDYNFQENCSKPFHLGEQLPAIYSFGGWCYSFRRQRTLVVAFNNQQGKTMRKYW